MSAEQTLSASKMTSVPFSSNLVTSEAATSAATAHGFSAGQALMAMTIGIKSATGSSQNAICRPR